MNIEKIIEQSKKRKLTKEEIKTITGAIDKFIMKLYRPLIAKEKDKKIKELEEKLETKEDLDELLKNAEEIARIKNIPRLKWFVGKVRKLEEENKRLKQAIDFMDINKRKYKARASEIEKEMEEYKKLKEE